MSVTDEIREVAKKLLREKQVELVIGYEQGTLPMRTRPVFVRSEEEADRLIWTGWCENDLVGYLAGRDGRTAIVAKACSVRAIVNCIRESRLKREDVVIIGVRCKGILDRGRVQDLLKGRTLTDAAIEGDELVLSGSDFEERVPCKTVLREECLYCTDPEPAGADYVVGPEAETKAVEDEYADIREMEQKPLDERWEWFSREMDKCIRCYACRNACPVCYCKECFADSTSPEWLSKGDALEDKQFFHIVRAFHTAGRCVDCGTCERVCPMGVKLRVLTRKIQKDVKELFGADAGTDLESALPLATFRPDDPDDFTE